MPLTPKQKEILDYILSFQQKHGYSPSQKEIAKHFGFKSLGTIQNYLVRLQREGFLQKQWNAKRALVVQQVTPPDPAPERGELKSPQRSSSPAAMPSLTLPLLGRVAAGSPIEAVENQELVDLAGLLMKPTEMGALFALEVKGDSMINDGIYEGDYVVIKKQATADNGDTVVAMIDNEATIKRYFRRGTRVELHAANEKYKPIVVEGDQSFRIEGVLRSVIRPFRRAR